MSGGLFRTDGGVRSSSGLDASDAGIAEAWAKVRSEAAPETWLLLEYEGKDKLKLRAAGTERPQLLASLAEDQVVFGALRTKAGKFLCLMCVGEEVGGMAKGRAAAHKNAAFNALEGTSGEVCGLSVRDFSQSLAEVDF
ncbi:unnamed protein product [Effrenium voratum]|uniref:ADF-H domain-containing protein n=1 Tax=Effrenium voratum TaxID=2562239 RepID=A0AA36JGW0_9DINO|nr:unnamed protein product [Effrenium voratum]CAJ1429708.1 unnamed protein product [Effrenium voratum]